jgi:predicted helicase
MTIPAYLVAVDKQYRTGLAREHAYRGDLQTLMSTLCHGVTVTNEPARIACGAPDFILTRQQVPVGYIEAKDIGVDLDSKSLKEQLDRYRGSLDNLIITDYLTFRFYRHGDLTATVRVAEVVGSKIKPSPANFDHFAALIADFAAWQGQTINSPKKLAAMMAGKARLLANVIEMAVSSDEESQANTNLREQLEAFKRVLIHDITPKTFADLYAQTIAYGMFAARLHDPTPDSFTRVEAATLIPKTNPFLRKLFQSISGYDLDERIAWIVDALADIFRATDIARLLVGFGKDSGREDAFMHFYEDFLSQYDPKLRKSRGVWYTPDAVVRFIVGAVDDILKADFGLPTGLADSSMVRIKRRVHTKATADKRSKAKDVSVEAKVHRVQVLDPAAGTGTFLAEVVRRVRGQFRGQEGSWSHYVEEHLIPRLNGFELLMASYAMAHLKMDLVLRDTGYDIGQPHGASHTLAGLTNQQRLRVFLTNSLEEAHPETGTLFASWLSDEANQASTVKRETPVMVVLGNPPYSGISTNKGDWITGLIEDYKYVDGEHFGERKHWLHDDYVKFIRLGEHLIEKTGNGVLAYINNHSFLDNPTFRGMRWHLLNTFDKIYVIDLHGNSTKKEVAPDGSKDDNVFDIKQGVSINIFVRTADKKKGQLGKVYHSQLWGAREAKYRVLHDSRLGDVAFQQLGVVGGDYVMVPLNLGLRKRYSTGFGLAEMFTTGTSGVQTSRDALVVDIDRKTLIRRLRDFVSEDRSDADIRQIYFADASGGKYPKGDTRGWRISEVRPELRQQGVEKHIRPYSYRPFDTRFICYTPLLVDWAREKVMHHLLVGPNVSLTVGRQGQVVGDSPWSLVYVQGVVSDLNLFYRGGGVVFPLFLYPEAVGKSGASSGRAYPNLDAKLVTQFATGAGLVYAFDYEHLWAHGTHKSLTPLDVLDYCYAVLHSPAYRSKYKEFLKSAFPRIPFPTDAAKFRALVRLGAKLRQLHLLEDPGINDFRSTFPVPGNNEVTRKMSAKSPGWVGALEGRGRVWINDSQYFDNVPERAWHFFVGGCQPAQKWLKDRQGRALTFDDIQHYQRMIRALAETGELMKEVDKVGVM